MKKSAKTHALVRNSGQKIKLELTKIQVWENISSGSYSYNEGANYDVRNRLSLYIYLEVMHLVTKALHQLERRDFP